MVAHSIAHQQITYNYGRTAFKPNYYEKIAIATASSAPLPTFLTGELSC